MTGSEPTAGTRRLLIGPAGAGKTHAVLADVAAMAARGERFLVLVPTYSQAEHLKRRLLRFSGRDAILDRGIATFEQLAERRTGVRLSSLVSPAVRDALLAAALEESAPPDFAAAARFGGFRRAALAFLDELSSIEPKPGADAFDEASSRLRAALEGLPAERRRRVEGLLDVLAAYRRRIAATGLLEHRDFLQGLLDGLRAGDGSPPLDALFVDGFTDLTEVQERIVHQLSATASRTTVTLLGDATSAPGGPFDACERMRRRFADAGFVADVLPPGPRHAAAPALAALERRLAGEDVRASDPGASLRVVAGADPDDEADRVARNVLRWTTEGVPRAEILVIVRNLASETAQRVLAALRRHGVPARRMGRRPLATIPAARSHLRAVRLLCGAPDDGDALAAILSGDARGVSDADADRLAAEARVLAVTETATTDGVAQVVQRKGLATAAAWLRTLAERALPAGPLLPHAAAERIADGIPVLVRSSFESGVPLADEDRAAEDAAALRVVIDVIRDVVRALRAGGRGTATAREVAQRIVSAAEDARVPVPDLRDDAVNVVGAEEARQWEARCVVVAGLRAGEFPGGAREDLFLTDDERAAVERTSRIPLPARHDEALRRERLLFYMAATRARERLAVTYPSAGGSGDPILRSPFVEDVLAAMPAGAAPDGAERAPGDQRPAPGETFHEDDLRRTALASLGERFVSGTASEVRAQTGAALCAVLAGAGDASLVRAAREFAPPEASLADGGPARAKIAEGRPRSASSLSDFAQCAFRHFAKTILSLRDPPAGVDDGLQPLLEGDIAHGALERLYQERIEGKPLDVARAALLFDEVYREKAGHLRPTLRTTAVRARLRRAVLAWVGRERETPLAAGYAPAMTEWRFGRDAGGLLRLCGDRVPVTGSADRCDVAADGERAIVVDWKTSRASRYSGLREKIDQGIELQLPLYALAVEKGLGLRVTAVAYVTLRDGGVVWLPISADAPPEALASKLRPEGYGVGDGSGARALAEGHLVRLDQEIRTGRIVADPRDDDLCRTCQVADICRFDGRPK